MLAEETRSGSGRGGRLSSSELSSSDSPEPSSVEEGGSAGAVAAMEEDGPAGAVAVAGGSAQRLAGTSAGTSA